MFPTDDSIQQIRSVQQNVFESSRLSPKVYPKFYKSPLFNEDEQQQQILTTPTNALDYSIPNSELHSPNNDEQQYLLPSTSEIFEGEEKSRKEELTQMTDAIFDLYILWSRDKQNILHSNIAAAPSLPSPSSSVSSPKPIRSPPRALRAASIAVSQPPPKPQKGILRRAATSFKK
uniref:Uncharacterized protein n=1 Tax=Meloidogyne floridensis TaxID=298350 RepID=A0A915NRT1_9BILA